MLHEPCRTPLMKPRERCGQLSIARAAPAGHSAPMPIPSKVRKINKNKKVGENPAIKLQIEYQKIEIISGVLRPIRSASQPEATAPTSRIHKVSVKTIATSVVGTWNSSAIGLMISRKTVKSKASSVHPNQAAHQAYHWSLVGSFHHGMVFKVSTAAIAPSPCSKRPLPRGLAPTVRASSGHRQFRDHHRALRLRAEHQRQDEIDQPEHRAHQHRNGEPQIPVDRE